MHKIPGGLAIACFVTISGACLTEVETSVKEIPEEQSAIALVVGAGNLELELGEVLQLHAEVTITGPVGLYVLDFASSDQAVATVSPQGLITAVAIGETTLTVRATLLDNGSFDSVAVVVRVTETDSVEAPPTTPEPYSGAPIVVPGSFDAEGFDRGGEGVAYHDHTAENEGDELRPDEGVDIFVTNEPGSGYLVKNFENGEWLAYTITVAQAGDFDLALRIAPDPAFPGAAFHIVEDDNYTVQRVSELLR